MNKLETNKELIERHEEQFAWNLAARVFEKPKMSVWMILIPIILVFHMYRHQRYVDGRRSFVENYLVTRRRMLGQALAMLRNGSRLDLDAIVDLSGVPDASREAYRTWVRLLVDFYKDLLSARGDQFEELVRSAYHNRSNYLLVLNQLNKAEKNFNATLKPEMEENAAAVEETVDRIESSTTTLRRDDAYRIFT